MQDNPKNKEHQSYSRNSEHQGVDKAPGEERGKGEQVKPENLKGKKVDADPEKESDQPLKRER